MLITQPPADGETADLLIVGAGAVGLALAISLSRQGRRVLVVEGGEERVDPDYALRNEIVQSGARHHRGASAGRYKGLGGTTRLWGGQLMPFTAADFAPNPARGKPGWPIGAAELAPYGDAAMQLLGFPGGWPEAARDWAGPDGALGDALEFAPSVWMRQPDLANSWGKELRSAPNLRVLLGHEAIAITIDPARGTVCGVTVTGPGGVATTIKSRNCVLACGTLETARLLLRTQARLPETPLGRNRHVGRWFIDHFHGTAGEVKPQDRARFGKLFDASYAGRVKILPKVRLSDAVVAKDHLPNCAGVFNGRLSPGTALTELAGLGRRVVGASSGGRIAALGEDLRTGGLIVPLVWRYLRQRRSATFLSGMASFGFELEQLPSPGSYLYLEPGVPAAEARLGLNWSVDGGEIAALTRLATAMQSYCKAQELGELEIDPRILQGDPAFLSECEDSFHQMGGARMAATADDGVVDHNCAVFGMAGLYLAGPATFASGSFANPTLTAIAMGLRLGEHLAMSKS